MAPELKVSLCLYGWSNIFRKFGEGRDFVIFSNYYFSETVRNIKDLTKTYLYKILRPTMFAPHVFSISRTVFEIFPKKYFSKKFGRGYVFSKRQAFGQNILEMFFITGNRKPSLPSTFGAILPQNWGKGVIFHFFVPLYLLNGLRYRSALSKKNIAHFKTYNFDFYTFLIFLTL